MHAFTAEIDLNFWPGHNNSSLGMEGDGLLLARS